MSAADDFLSLYDEQGSYKNSDGEIAVIFGPRNPLVRSWKEEMAEYRRQVEAADDYL